MTGYTKITEANMNDFPIGTKVHFNYGAMCGGEDGTITGCGKTQWGCFLTATTENGEEKQISGISTTGVGVYLT